jgi:Flp pilus assembly protein TadD
MADAGQLEAAIELFERATLLDPSSAGAHLNLGVALDRAGRQSDALRSFEQALALDPTSPRIHLALGTLQWAAGEVESARVHLELARDAGLELPPAVADGLDRSPP